MMCAATRARLVTNAPCVRSGKNANYEEADDTLSRSEEKNASDHACETEQAVCCIHAHEAKPAAPAAKLEVRRAVPLDYVTTNEVDLRSTPDLAAPKLSGGSLRKGTVVKIAPQDWWYVEVERPATASGVLRGWLLNAVLRR